MDIPNLNYMTILRKLNTIATIYDTASQILDMIMDPDTSGLEVLSALGRRIITSLLLGEMCKLKTLWPVVTALVTGFGLINQFDAIFEAAKEGRWDLVAFRTIQLITQIVSLSQSCFTGDTLVSTEYSSKRIDEIKLGDKVWAYDIETDSLELKEVTRIYVKESKEILHLTLSTGDIDTTSNHPFYELDKGWVAAGDLELGDRIYTIDGDVSIVEGYWIEKLDEPVKVYNLEVEGYHTYFVGGVLVHNYKNSKRMTTQEASIAAKELGYEKTNFTSHGQPVYKKGNKYITPDVDSHSGGVWKMANSIKNLGSKSRRSGTYDAELKKIGG